jgi:hypothetical protein
MNLLSYSFEGNSKAAIVCQTDLREQDVCSGAGQAGARTSWLQSVRSTLNSLLPMFALRAQADKDVRAPAWLLTVE